MRAFRNRTTEAELMDDTTLAPEKLNEVLRDVSLANRLLGGNRITHRAVLNILQKEPDKEFSIMDVGCGEGAMLRQLALICRKNKYRVSFRGLDINKAAINLAEKYSADFPEIKYYTKDILQDDVEGLVSDIVLCTLTLHHIPTAQIPKFLEKLSHVARVAVVVNDLQRSPWAYYLFKIFSTIFIKTKIARHDGLVSVKRGFKRKELFAFSSQVSDYYSIVKWKWAFRYLLILAPSKSMHHD
ncbi:methyltransferase domain-containing protein [Flavobacteriaceae bacterium D16]|nr:methyltransferase domain-containing protein [Flavobacteriaceae bacterium D16]